MSYREVAQDSNDDYYDPTYSPRPQPLFSETLIAEEAIDAYQNWCAPDSGDEAPAAAAHVEGYDSSLDGYWCHVIPAGDRQCLRVLIYRQDDGSYTHAPESWEWDNEPFCGACPTRPSA